MRDIALIITFFSLLVLTFRSPFLALLVYYWISFMNPHRLTWGIAYNFPFAYIAALVAFISIVYHYKELRLPVIQETFMFMFFWLFLTITTIFSFYPEDAWGYWITVSKIFLMTLLTMLVITTPKKLLYFLISIIAFVGFYGVKGGIFTLMMGGKYRIFGPPDSYIADANALGVALVMIVPLCFYVRKLVNNKWINRSIAVIGIFSLLSALVTYSRGALLGVLVMVFFMFLKSKYKFRTAVFTLILAVVIIPFLPNQWFERMDTIKTYRADASAGSRIWSWKFSYNLAKNNLLGGGFLCFQEEQYYQYVKEPDWTDQNYTFEDQIFYHLAAGDTAHSIYFQIMVEHGFIGLTIFLLLIFSTLYSLSRLEKYAKSLKEAKWIVFYSKGFFVSIISFLVSGAFLSMAYFDLFWAIFAGFICLKYMVISGNLKEIVSPKIADKKHT